MRVAKNLFTEHSGVLVCEASTIGLRSGDNPPYDLWLYGDEEAGVKYILDAVDRDTEREITGWRYRRRGAEAHEVLLIND